MSKIRSIFSWIVQNRVIIVLFSIFVIIYLIAWNRGLVLLYLISALSLATLVLSFIAPYFNLLGVTASVKHPKSAHQGETIPVIFTMQSPRFLGRYLLELWWEIPFTQNLHHMFFIAKLRGQQILEAQILCEIRGLHQTGPLYMQTGFPLGIRVHNKILSESQSEVLVYPKPVPVSNFTFGSDESSIVHGNIRSNRKGGHDEFMAIREYKPGDSPRYIHWPTSAKKGELMVREYQDTLSSSLIIVLDLSKAYNVGKGKHTTLEYAITIAASLALHALDEGYRVSIFGYSKEKIELVDIVGAHNHLQVLESLAHARSDGDESYADTLSHFLSFHQKGGTLVLFDNGSGRVNKKMDFYASHFFKPVLFDIRAKSFKTDIFNKEFTRESTSKQSIYTLEKGCDIEGIFR